MTTTGKALKAAALALALALSAGSAWAVQPDEILDDPVLEQRARDISKNLRCLVCQNQSIDESEADLARDIRLLVRERLVAGDSDEEAINFIVARYGDWVLLRPPFKLKTAALWFGPIAIAVIGGILFVRVVRRRSDAGLVTVEPLSDEERRRVEALLKRT